MVKKMKPSPKYLFDVHPRDFAVIHHVGMWVTVLWISLFCVRHVVALHFLVGGYFFLMAASLWCPLHSLPTCASAELVEKRKGE